MWSAHRPRRHASRIALEPNATRTTVRTRTAIRCLRILLPMKQALAASGDSLASTLSIASFAVALVAVLISLASLYRSQLAPFAVVTVVGYLRLRVYPIQNGDRSWYITSADIPVEVVNSGARVGRILQYRLKVSYPSLQIDGAYETFRAAWVVDNRLFTAAGSDRFDWLKSAVIDDWKPFSVLPKAAVEQHIVFEKRWDDPVVAQEIVFTLQQARDGQRGWADVGSWKLWDINDQMFADMARGASYGTLPEGVPNGYDLEIQPVDLHRHLKPVGPLPGPDPGDKGSRLVKFTKKHRDARKI